MNIATFNRLFGLFIILMALFFSYYPDYYEKSLTYYEMIDFYLYMKILLVSLLIITPVFYIIFNHRLKTKRQKINDLYPPKNEWTPSVWQVMDGSSNFNLIITFYIMLIIPGIIIFAITTEEFGYSDISAFLAIASLSIPAITLLASPIFFKTLKVNRLFRIGEEVECIFTGMLDTGSSSNPGDSINIYSYIFNGETYSVKGKQLDNQKRLIKGKSKLTVLLDPAKPNKAIVKENYLPNANSIKYTTDCLNCGAAVEQGKIEKDNVLCTNCNQIFNAFNAIEKDAQLFYSNFSSYKLVCSECKTKLVLDKSESTLDYISIFCRDCGWSTALFKV